MWDVLLMLKVLSLEKIMCLSDDEAFQTFKAIRWANNGGEAYCEKCGCTAVYEYKSRRIFKCKGCESQFSITSGTIFASRKMSIRDLLAAIFTLRTEPEVSVQEISRRFACQWKTSAALKQKALHLPLLRSVKREAT